MNTLMLKKKKAYNRHSTQVSLFSCSVMAVFLLDLLSSHLFQGTTHGSIAQNIKNNSNNNNFELTLRWSLMPDTTSLQLSPSDNAQHITQCSRSGVGRGCWKKNIKSQLGVIWWCNLSHVYTMFRHGVWPIYTVTVFIRVDFDSNRPQSYSGFYPEPVVS